jgi:type VI secretion system protein ImpB
MAAQSLTADISVPDALSDAPSGAELAVSLRFNSLADFRPENIAAQVPALRRLLELRTALVALKGPVVNVPGFVRKIRELLKEPEQRARLLRELEIADPATSTTPTTDDP